MRLNAINAERRWRSQNVPCSSCIINIFKREYRVEFIFHLIEPHFYKINVSAFLWYSSIIRYFFLFPDNFCRKIVNHILFRLDFYSVGICRNNCTVTWSLEDIQGLNNERFCTLAKWWLIRETNQVIHSTLCPISCLLYPVLLAPAAEMSSNMRVSAGPIVHYLTCTNIQLTIFLSPSLSLCIPSLSYFIADSFYPRRDVK